MSYNFENDSISPYYRALLDSLGSEHPLRRTVLPLDDRTPAPNEWADPLGEEAHSPCSGLIHTYPDKVLLLATLDCAVHCQYCTRGRLLQNHHTTQGTIFPGIEKALQTLETLDGVRDVLLSGGDPLTLSDEVLDTLFSKVRKIQSIQTVRLGSKVPAVLPSRITKKLAALLAKHRIWLQLHFIHPAELTAETSRALDLLAEAGVPMVSQTVLLKGINDEVDVLSDLFYGLLKNRVKPYYLFQCDPVLGSSSFRTPVQRGLDLMRELQGRVSGLALPHFCIDAPGGGGKITLLPNTPLHREGDAVILTNYQGLEYRYFDPLSSTE